MELISAKGLPGYVPTAEALGADPASIMRSVHIDPKLLVAPPVAASDSRTWQAKDALLWQLNAW